MYVSLKQSIRKKEESEHVNIFEIAEKLEKLCMKGKLKHETLQFTDYFVKSCIGATGYFPLGLWKWETVERR